MIHPEKFNPFSSCFSQLAFNFPSEHCVQYNLVMITQLYLNPGHVCIPKQFGYFTFQ